MSRIRNFVFTQNNPDAADYEFWTNLATTQRQRDRVQVGYVVFQTEQGLGRYDSSGQHRPGTIHIQGYVELTRAIRLNGIRRRFPDGIHIEQRRGTQAQAIAYCKKEETRVESGITGEGGEAKKLGKDKLSVVAEVIKQGGDLSTIAHDYPVSSIKYGAKIVKWALDLKGGRDGETAPSIIILYGSTGTGKSNFAREKYPGAFWVPAPKKGGWWWTNYMGQTVVILDEFRDSVPFREILRLFDRYPYTVQVKGVCMNCLATTIVVTTNKDPMQWYNGMSWESKAPLRRRFHDYAKIYDVADDSKWDDFKYVIRDQVTV